MSEIDIKIIIILMSENLDLTGDISLLETLPTKKFRKHFIWYQKRFVIKTLTQSNEISNIDNIDVKVRTGEQTHKV